MATPEKPIDPKEVAQLSINTVAHVQSLSIDPAEQIAILQSAAAVIQATLQAEGLKVAFYNALHPKNNR